MLREELTEENVAKDDGVPHGFALLVQSLTVTVAGLCGIALAAGGGGWLFWGLAQGDGIGALVAAGAVFPLWGGLLLLCAAIIAANSARRSPWRAAAGVAGGVYAAILRRGVAAGSGALMSDRHSRGGRAQRQEAARSAKAKRQRSEAPERIRSAARGCIVFGVLAGLFGAVSSGQLADSDPVVAGVAMVALFIGAALLKALADILEELRHPTAPQHAPGTD